MLKIKTTEHIVITQFGRTPEQLAKELRLPEGTENVEEWCWSPRTGWDRHDGAGCDVCGGHGPHYVLHLPIAMVGTAEGLDEELRKLLEQHRRIREAVEAATYQSVPIRITGPRS